MLEKELTIIYLCNAIDDFAKKERNITFDSPAATNKVLGIARALKNQNVNIKILSLGRAKQSGSWIKHPVLRRTVSDIQFYYAAFWHIPVMTHIVGAISMVAVFLHLMRNEKSNNLTVLAYNRFWHYLPTLIVARLIKIPCYLDLEDGVIPAVNIKTRLFNYFSQKAFDILCSAGSLMAAKSLVAQLKTQSNFVCYGCVETLASSTINWKKKPINIIFGGSLLVDTGVNLLIDTVKLLNLNSPQLKAALKFTITGQGSMAEELLEFSKLEGKQWINYYGNVDREEYKKLLYQAHIGLCLKLSSSDMGKTTFPSKIIEYASSGLLIISTKVSDVPDILDNQSAILLSEETPEALAKILQDLATDYYDMQILALQGQKRIYDICSIDTLGKQLKSFFMKGFK